VEKIFDDKKKSEGFVRGYRHSSDKKPARDKKRGRQHCCGGGGERERKKRTPARSWKGGLHAAIKRVRREVSKRPQENAIEWEGISSGEMGVSVLYTFI